MVPLSAYSDNSGNPTQIDYLGWAFVPLGGLIGGVLGYFIKRKFVKQDIRFQQQVEHEQWLLQQFDKLAETYYFPLAKFSKDAHVNIMQSSISKDVKSIQIAYYYFVICLKKYLEFKQSTGANFLFRDQNMENEAIKKFSALLIGIPFDDLELNDLIKKTFDANGNFDDKCFSQNFYKIFENWIKSSHCKRSRSLVIGKLKNLANVLDQGSEDTVHPKSYERRIEKTPTISFPLTNNKFWIIALSTKSVRSGEKLMVFGNDFTNQYVDFRFLLGDLLSPLKILNQTDGYIELQIPQDIAKGIYDVYAVFQEKSWYAQVDYTIGIPLKVEIP